MYGFGVVMSGTMSYAETCKCLHLPNVSLKVEFLLCDFIVFVYISGSTARVTVCSVSFGQRPAVCSVQQMNAS